MREKKREPTKRPRRLYIVTKSDYKPFLFVTTSGREAEAKADKMTAEDGKPYEARAYIKAANGTHYHEKAKADKSKADDPTEKPTRPKTTKKR